MSFSSSIGLSVSSRNSASNRGLGISVMARVSARRILKSESAARMSGWFFSPSLRAMDSGKVSSAKHGSPADRIQPDNRKMECLVMKMSVERSRGWGMDAMRRSNGPHGQSSAGNTRMLKRAGFNGTRVPERSAYLRRLDQFENRPGRASFRSRYRVQSIARRRH